MMTYFKTVCFTACVALAGNTSLLAADANPAPASAGKPDPSLIIYYSFDNDFGEEVQDQSGKGHPGIARGGKWEKNGKVGGCYTFGGEDADRIDVDLSNVQELKAYTIELWVKHKQPKAADFCRLFDAGERIGFFINFAEGADGKLVHMLALDDGWGNGLNSPDPLPLDKWNHVAAVWDGKSIMIFINGVQQEGESDRSGKLKPLEWARIGWLLTGSVDEFKMYNRALSAEEIKKHFTEVK